MTNTFPYLSKSQQEKVTALTIDIVKKVNPEKIICYGSHNSVNNDWNVFAKGDDYQQITFSTTFDLLVIANAQEKKDDHELIQIIESHAETLQCHITCVVLRMKAASELLKQGQRFVNTVFAKGLLLYNTTIGTLYPTPVLPDVATVSQEAEAAWIQDYTIAEKFNKSAIGCMSDNWPEQAMFNFHQATQHTCSALIRCFTGHKPTTHNLSRLLSLVESFTPLLITIFPRVTTEETELFNLLNRAYSEARYKDNYIVPIKTANIIGKRIEELMILAQKLYDEQLCVLKSENNISFPIIIKENAAHAIPN